MYRHQLLARAIALSVPVLNLVRRPTPWPYSLDDLAEMPEESWGGELHRFLASRGLDYLPNYEEHDAYHALLGYGTTVTEELKLQAFMVGNGSATVAGRGLLLLGAIVLPSTWRRLRVEFDRGRRAAPLRRFDAEGLIPFPLVTVRRTMWIV